MASLLGKLFKMKVKPPLPSDVPMSDNNLNSISASPPDVECILKSLQPGKATGPLPMSDLFNFTLAVVRYL